MAINRENFAMNVRLQTSLPAGSYCDAIHSANSCASVTVDASGFVQVSISAMDAFAIYRS